MFRLDGIEELEREIFGPVLHVATFGAEEIDQVVDAVNARGYGLTFGLHTRVDARVQRIVDRVDVGNVYVNRNQIGAVVGSQPFGGEGLSGTGPKAGGPHYVARFMKGAEAVQGSGAGGTPVNAAALQEAIDRVSWREWAGAGDRATRLEPLANGAASTLNAALAFGLDPVDMPGPTGESNRLEIHPRGLVLCLGPTRDSALAQAMQALALGNGAVVVMPGADAEVAALAKAGAPVVGVEGTVEPKALAQAQGFDVVASAADEDTLRAIRKALAKRDGMLVQLVTERVAPERYVLERHLCIDTTAAGGNATLIAAVSE